MQKEKVVFTLFVPALWALAVSGAALILIDATCLLLLIWLAKKLLRPVIVFFSVRPNAVAALKDVAVHLGVLLFLVSVIAIAHLPQEYKYIGQMMIVAAILIIALINHRKRIQV